MLAACTDVAAVGDEGWGEGCWGWHSRGGFGFKCKRDLDFAFFSYCVIDVQIVNIAGSCSPLYICRFAYTVYITSPRVEVVQGGTGRERRPTC